MPIVLQFKSVGTSKQLSINMMEILRSSNSTNSKAEFSFLHFLSCIFISRICQRPHTVLWSWV